MEKGGKKERGGQGQTGRGGGGGGRGRGEEGGSKKGGVAGGSSLENLHAMVAGVSHDDAPIAVDGNAAKRVRELSVA